MNARRLQKKIEKKGAKGERGILRDPSQNVSIYELILQMNLFESFTHHRK